MYHEFYKNVRVYIFIFQKYSGETFSMVSGKLINTIYLSSKISPKLMWHVKAGVVWNVYAITDHSQL